MSFGIWSGNVSGSGTPGADGKSAYQIALENGFAGTEDEWLESLKGKDGQPGRDGIDGINGLDGQPGQDGKDGIDGQDGLPGKDGAPGSAGPPGENGKSAYEIAVENGTFTGTEVQWLESLRGTDGATGKDGLSAYELAFLNGFAGTAEEWLASLKGDKGNPGQNGTPGADGFSPTIKVDTENETEYILKITTTEGSFKTPNLKGSSNTDINIEVNWQDKIAEVIEIADRINREVV